MSSTASTDAISGTLLGGRYQVGRRIARGGMATVYEATDTRLKRTVALKLMHQAYAEDTDFLKRFQREARSAALLSHPNVVAVFDQGVDVESGASYLTMEYVKGRTLRGLLREHGPLPPEVALELLDSILDALGAAHAAGLVHRDVKPENVLIGEGTGRPTVKVADFGLARAVSGGTTATQGILIGTVSYLAPEQLTGERTDARSDVYAAGVVLYEMLTGCKPHEGESPMTVAYKHVNEDVPAPSLQVPELPAFLDGLVQRATARDPAVRPADARVFLHQLRRARTALEQGVDDPELAEDLLSFRRTGDTVEHTVVVPQDALPTVETQPGTPPPASPPARPDYYARRRKVLALALVLLLAVGGTAYWFGFGRYTQVPQVLTANEVRLDRYSDTTGLRFETAGKIWNDSLPVGQVVRSDPAPGERILSGGTVRVWLSKGRERHPMPRVVGRSEKDARALLAAARLRVSGIERVYRDLVPNGRVVLADKDPGTVLYKGTTVRLTVSRGPAPVDIPSVQGKPMPKVETTLQGLGLRWTKTEEFSDTVPRGSVISQKPGPGAGHRGDRLALTVSKGPEFLLVPDVKTKTGEEATKILEGLGFEVEIKRHSPYVGLNRVIEESPAPDTRVRSGSKVVLEIV